MGGRQFYLAREMVKQGYTVYLIAASYTHFLRSPPRVAKSFELEIVDGINFVWVKVPVYENSHSKQRILNWFLFAWKLLKLPKIITDKPDVILASSPTIVLFLAARKLAKKFKSRLVFEVRDIWPLTLVNVGGYSEKHPFIRFLQWIEDGAYRDADVVVSNLPNAVEHMVERGMDKDKFLWIPNGFSLDEVKNKQPLPLSVSEQIPKDKFIVGYTGTLGVANALYEMLEVAELLKEYGDISFMIVGDGKEKAKLKQLVIEKELRNIVFIDPILKTQIQSMLHEFDICYIGLLHEPLFRFGVSPNKLFDYFYSERPILYAIDSGKYLPVDEAKAGISVSDADPKTIAAAILELREMTVDERRKLGRNGHRYVKENHNYSILAEKLAKVIFE
ncbi:MAG: glycosyltransferase family 4 protein [Piscirickettsiaceae bacterium]|nr:glycosyltransferase family 4 protein [Piscirickettsiaceae bacterium]